VAVLVIKDPAGKIINQGECDTWTVEHGTVIAKKKDKPIFVYQLRPGDQVVTQ
jgi:hypothetical protein